MLDGVRTRFQRRVMWVAPAALVAAFLLFRLSNTPALPRAPLGTLDEPIDLPDGRMVYSKSVLGGGPEAPALLYAAQADGREEHQITFGDARDRAPALLPDGRVAFRRRLRGDRIPGRLFAINPDGTGMQIYSEPAADASIEGGPWVVGNRVIFVEQPLHGGSQRLVAVSVVQPLGDREILSPSDGRFASATPRTRPLSLTSVVDERKSTGTLLCLDVRASRDPGVAHAKPGDIRTVRVLAADGTLLNEAPVEVDGSFFVEVPANRPLRLELYDSSGVVAADQSQFWVRPNENRGCIGCHEDPELAPENRAVRAVDRGPTQLAAIAASAHPGDH